MKPLIDLHTHTVASGHAFSTLKENIEAAQEVGLKVFGTSDHAMEMPGACHPFLFGNYRVVPRQIGDLKILCGIEANIMDYNGRIDVSEELAKKLDYIIASLHPGCCIKPGTREENTAAVVKAMDNPYVRIIGHPDDNRIPLHLEEVVKAAAEKKVVLEVNNSSLDPRSARIGAQENVRKLLQLAKEYRTPIILGTDSHICYQVGRFDDALKLLEEADFPEELVINYDVDRLSYVLKHC
jgi:putative hydrolase